MHCLCALASNAHLSPAQGQGQVLVVSASSKGVLAMSFCPNEEQLQNKRRQSEHTAQARSCFVMVLAHHSESHVTPNPSLSGTHWQWPLMPWSEVGPCPSLLCASQMCTLLGNFNLLLGGELCWNKRLEQSPIVGWGVHCVGHRKPVRAPGSFQSASSALFLGVSKHVCSLFMSSVLVSYSLPVKSHCFSNKLRELILLVLDPRSVVPNMWPEPPNLPGGSPSSWYPGGMGPNLIAPSPFLPNSVWIFLYSLSYRKGFLQTSSLFALRVDSHFDVFFFNTFIGV